MLDFKAKSKEKPRIFSVNVIDLTLFFRSIILAIFLLSQTSQAANSEDHKMVIEPSLYWKLELSNTVNPLDFGVIGDGKTDNAKALIRLRDDLIKRGRDTSWHIIFPEGHYTYSNNRWIMGLKRVRISGLDNVRLQNTSKGRNINDYNPFPRQGMFSLNGDIDSSGAVKGEEAELFVTGHKVQSLKKGTLKVPFLNPKHVEFYRVGQRILIHGFALMNYGYSPNPREFEWHEIEKISNGALYLKRPLKGKFDINWPDFEYSPPGKVNMGKIGQSRKRGPVTIQPVYLGKPRVLLLDDRAQIKGTYYYPETVWLENITFLANPYAVTTHSLAIPARHVILKNLTLTGHDNFNLYPRESEVTVIENCDISGVVEFDKVTIDAILNNSTVRRNISKHVHAIKGGSGTRNILISNNNINGRVNVVAMDRLQIEYNRIDSSKTPRGSISFYNGSFGGQIANIVYNKFITRPFQEKLDKKMLLQSYRIRNKIKPNGVIHIPRQNHHTRKHETVPHILRAMRPGLKVWLQRDANVFGIVDDVYLGEDGSLELHWNSGNLPETVTPKDTLVWKTMQTVNFKGNEGPQKPH